MVEYVCKEVTVGYNLESFPENMKKKITLYKHFKKFFSKKQNKTRND